MKSAYLCLLLILSCSLYTSAQQQTLPTDSTKKIVKNIKGRNTVKVELLFKQYEITTINTRTGSRRSAIVNMPFVRINDKKPVMLDKQAQAVEPFLRNCSLSMDQIRQGQDDMRRARRFGYLMYGVGPALALGSVVVNGSKDPGAVFFTMVGLGVGSMVTGMIYRTKYGNRAYDRYEDAIDLYNRKCFIGDTSHPAVKPLPKDFFRKGESPYHYDTVMYTNLESKPEDYSAYGIAFNPLYIERSALNTHVGFTMQAFAYFHSSVDLSVEYSRAYADNQLGQANGKGIGRWVNSGIVGPATGVRKNANSLNIVGAVHLLKWEKEFDYTVKLSKGKYGSVVRSRPGGSYGKQVKTISLRAGFMTRNLVQERYKEDDMFSSPTVELADYANKFSGWPVMMKSKIASVGIAYNQLRDIAVTMKNGAVAGYSSHKNAYLDFLYATNIQFMDNGYYTFDNAAFGYTMTERIPMGKTPASRIGFRFGGDAIFFRTKHFGMSNGMELGLAPGPQEASLLSRGFIKAKIGIVFANRVR